MTKKRLIVLCTVAVLAALLILTVVSGRNQAESKKERQEQWIIADLNALYTKMDPDNVQGNDTSMRLSASAEISSLQKLLDDYRDHFRKDSSYDLLLNGLDQFDILLSSYETLFQLIRARGETKENAAFLSGLYGYLCATQGDMELEKRFTAFAQAAEDSLLKDRYGAFSDLVKRIRNAYEEDPPKWTDSAD